jgi:4-carboxymuconolactone decarboxylase
MGDQSRRERGKRKFEAIAQLPAFDPPDAFTAATLDRIFGDLWQRPGLSDRERRLLSIAIVGARGMDFEAKTHIGGALKSGDVSPAEMMEVILHVAYYAGWPHAAVLYRSFRALCAELDLDVPGSEDVV